ncbi:MAG TPA: ABC transporter permease [Candidatus Baltobacteraceae bacterium]
MTRIFAYVQEAATSLWRNRSRSLLTILGMIIGSASIITVFGISKGATSGISATFDSFGSLGISVLADSTQDYPDQAQIQYRDAASVSAALGSLAIQVMPFWQRDYPVAVGKLRSNYPVVSDGAYHPDKLIMSEGRKIDAADVAGAARVCVLTAGLADKFFHGQPALGQVIRVNGSAFTVAGVYANIQGSFFNSVIGADSIAIPYSTFDRMNPGPADQLFIYPAPGAPSAQVEKVAVATLQHIHGARAKYISSDNTAAIGTFSNVLNVIGIGLSAIGGVALVVAGIGIMNIMLVSVTERTREIGLRKSIGASRGDIALQFLMEAVLLAVAGGGTGMALGLLATIGAASIISKQLGAVIIPYLLIVSIALVFSITIGMVFGTYPALRAARMDPIEALRS